MQSPVAVAMLKSIASARLRWDEDGQDLLEYGLLVALIALVAHWRGRHRRKRRERRVLAEHCQQFLAGSFAALATGLLIATVIDIQTRRIPNVLTAAMAGAGFGLAAGIRRRLDWRGGARTACSDWR